MTALQPLSSSEKESCFCDDPFHSLFSGSRYRVHDSLYKNGTLRTEESPHGTRAELLLLFCHVHEHEVGNNV